MRGQNAGNKYRPGPRFEVCNEKGGAVVYRGETKPWNGGKVSELAGDRVWHADFSGLRTPGSYYLHDPVRKVRSYSFRDRRRCVPAGAARLGADVLLSAERNGRFRRGTVATGITAAGTSGVTRTARPSTRRAARRWAEPRDVLGGWFDAGDMNKYVPYLESTLFDLLWAYELNPRSLWR